MLNNQYVQATDRFIYRGEVDHVDQVRVQVEVGHPGNRNGSTTKSAFDKRLKQSLIPDSKVSQYGMDCYKKNAMH